MVVTLSNAVVAERGLPHLPISQDHATTISEGEAVAKLPWGAQCAVPGWTLLQDFNIINRVRSGAYCAYGRMMVLGGNGMKKDSKDPEVRFFFQQLRHTLLGSHYYMRCMEMRIAFLEIRNIEFKARRGEIPRARARALIDDWRQSYAATSRYASEALDKLTENYDWPSDSRVDRSFQWQPARRHPRSAPKR